MYNEILNETFCNELKGTSDFKRNISRTIWKQLLSLLGLTAALKPNVGLPLFIVCFSTAVSISVLVAVKKAASLYFATIVDFS